MPRSDVAVVGAGFSGVLTALSLLEAARSDIRIHLVERAERFGVGAAFGARQPDHLLNVRAMNMSADPDHPEDFAIWLAARRGGSADPFAFASRAEYGVYIQERLRRVVQTHAAADRLHLIGDEVLAIHPERAGFRLSLALGRVMAVDKVVLATGNAPPSAGVLPDPRFAAHPAYFGSPWTPGAFAAIGEDDPLLLLGAGLSMVDVMASLDAQGHRGEVLALSRRGLVPRRHAPVPAQGSHWERSSGESLSESLRRFRRDAAGSGEWRELFDVLRGQTQAHWRAMPLVERARFLRHLRPWWDVHRHRLAPIMADRLEAWRADRLAIVAGRLEGLTDRGDGVVAAWRSRGARATETRWVRFVINCTGPDGDPRQNPLPLMRQLLRDGLVRPDALGLGLDVNEDGRLISADGQAQQNLFAVGPVARGALWEVTAVPDIRVAARRLGRTLANMEAAPAL